MTFTLCFPRSATTNRQSVSVHRQRGLTLVELIFTVTIVSILSMAALPLARVSIKRQKEVELRRALREMREAIDRYKDASDRGFIEVKFGSDGYPPDMETLVKGVTQLNAIDKKLRFLRRIPKDPMTGAEWGMRSSQDTPDSNSFGGQNVYDVYTKSTATALDGTKYSDW
ncbi:MAG: type II secretion system GspH family protein [Acidobacteria bacterium]|nr:type II secretion system GspH family protein [Acidobacteriota bacterium]MCI0723735.1 type II secretion system GspH family protein [Acidobacteriota bacterium]